MRSGPLLAVGLFLWAVACNAQDAGKTFHEQVAPVLMKQCIACHNNTRRSGELSLETLADAVKGGGEGPAIVAGKRNESLLYLKITAPSGGEPEMPKEKPPLSPEEVELIGKWIDDGAVWPKEIFLKEKPKAGDDFWSLQPLSQAEPPAAEDAPPEWRRNPIDRFVWAKLKEKGLTPAPPADARTFIRRATYDLTGLPPTPEEIAEFAEAYARDRDAAVEQLIDRLLASPRYGERWGRHWLDVARFGESRGYERNEIIRNLWPFRDYIIKSFNDDKPFDQLVREHLAGDVLAPDDFESVIASAFLVAGPYDDVGNSDPAAAAQIRADQMDEMVRATSEAFLGVTLGCCRCHDHKFDPLTHRDYYAMASAFAGTYHGPRHVISKEQQEEVQERLKQLQERVTELEGKKSQLPQEEEERHRELDQLLTETREKIQSDSRLRETWWVGTHRPAPGPFHVFLGGSPQKKGEEVRLASFEVLKGREGSYEMLADVSEGERRVALANWIASPNNPLTPRVLANRIWHYHFGVGIVDTPSDFGYMGGRPSHPELLDWLANELLRGGWRIKQLHRLIMTSQAYQQRSARREEAARIDGDNRLLWRFSPRRLSAEEVRDTMLAVSGKLDLRMGGPGYQLYEYQQDNVATYLPLDVHGPETYRRAVYHHNARAMRVDLLTEFDSPDPALSEPRRSSTTSALQALTLLNHRFTLDMASALAEQAKQAGPEAAAQITRVFQLAFGREPTAEELAEAKAIVDEVDAKSASGGGVGLRAICRAILNSNEFLYLD